MEGKDYNNDSTSTKCQLVHVLVRVVQSDSELVRAGDRVAYIANPPHKLKNQNKQN